MKKLVFAVNNQWTELVYERPKHNSHFSMDLQRSFVTNEELFVSNTMAQQRGKTTISTESNSFLCEPQEITDQTPSGFVTWRSKDGARLICSTIFEQFTDALLL